jgi:hypothetical protein
MSRIRKINELICSFIRFQNRELYKKISVLYLRLAIASEITADNLRFLSAVESNRG